MGHYWAARTNRVLLGLEQNSIELDCVQLALACPFGGQVVGGQYHPIITSHASDLVHALEILEGQSDILMAIVLQLVDYLLFNDALYCGGEQGRQCN